MKLFRTFPYTFRFTVLLLYSTGAISIGAKWRMVVNQHGRCMMSASNVTAYTQEPDTEEEGDK